MPPRLKIRVGRKPEVVRDATEEEVLHAVTGRRARRPRDGEVTGHIARERRRVQARQRRERRDGITALIRQHPGMTRRRAIQEYDSTH